jgi:hypothetical protein
MPAPRIPECVRLREGCNSDQHSRGKPDERVERRHQPHVVVNLDPPRGDLEAQLSRRWRWRSQSRTIGRNAVGQQEEDDGNPHADHAKTVALAGSSPGFDIGYAQGEDEAGAETR